MENVEDDNDDAMDSSQVHRKKAVIALKTTSTQTQI